MNVRPRRAINAKRIKRLEKLNFENFLLINSKYPNINNGITGTKNRMPFTRSIISPSNKVFLEAE